MWLSWWLGSLFVMALVVWGVATMAAVTLCVLCACVLGLTVLLRTIRLPAHRLVRVGYWFVDPREVASLHFLPPVELRATRRAMAPLAALRSLRDFLRRLDAVGIAWLYVETDLALVQRLGFERLWPASPLAWIFIAVQSWVATGRWSFRWPWLYVYRPLKGQDLPR